jgi:hypothetical protein
MKTLTVVGLLAMGLAANGMAAQFKGFVEDQQCASNPAMKDDVACAKKCIGGGSVAVLVSEDGKVYKIANQDKIVAHAGEKVTLDATLKGDTLTIAKVQ